MFLIRSSTFLLCPSYSISPILQNWSYLAMNYPFIKQEALGLAKKNQRTKLRPYRAPVDDIPLSIAIPTDQAQGYLHSDKVSPREAHWHRIMTPMPSQTLLGDLLLASKTPVQDELPQEISRKRHAEDGMQDVNPAVSEVTDFPLKTSKRRRCTSTAQAENKPSDQPLLPGGNQPHLKDVGKDLQDLRAQIQHLRLVSAKRNRSASYDDHESTHLGFGGRNCC